MAQGRTIEETVEIARDVAKKLIELHAGWANALPAPPALDEFDYKMVMNA